MKKKKKKSRFLASHLMYSILVCVCVCLQELKLSSPLHLFMVSEPGLGEKELWAASKKRC